MRFANVRDLKNKTSEILRYAEKEEVIITSRGKPRAVIKGVTENNFEDYLIEHSSKFLRALETAGARHADYEHADGETDESQLSAPSPLPAAQGSGINYLAAVFWDYPDFADRKKLQEFLEECRGKKDWRILGWILTRFLERARVVDTFKFFRLEEIREFLPKLRLSPYGRKKWNRMLEVYGKDSNLI